MISGKYKSGLGNGPCDECPKDVDNMIHFSPPGSTASDMCLVTCQSGRFTTNGSPCVLCESGKYKAIAGTGLCIDACPLNTDSEQGAISIDE